MSIDELELSVRTYNLLKRAGIDTIKELCSMTEAELLEIINMEQDLLDEIKSKLQDIGYDLVNRNEEPKDSISNTQSRERMLGYYDIIDGYYDTPENEDDEIQASLRTRSDGKILCSKLKQARKALADANGIPYEIEECSYDGPCAGSCPKCDAEIAYIEEKLEEIPEEDRVFPKLDMSLLKEFIYCKDTPHDRTMIKGNICPPGL